MNQKIDSSESIAYNISTKYPYYEWDPAKNAQNSIKHGVSFEEAITVFDDVRALLIFDRNHSDDEERFIIIGASEKMRVLYVCHCYRQPGERIRLISARKATETERVLYEKGLSED